MDEPSSSTPLGLRRRSNTLDSAILNSIKPEWKRNLHLLLEHPASSPSAFLVHVATTALIVFSSFVTIIETVPSVHRTSPKIWFGIETSLVMLFTVEYLARCLAWSGNPSMFWGWFKSFFSCVDLLAIVPYYVEVISAADTSTTFRFSILRTFRLLRVFRPFRYSNTIVFTIEVMILSFKRSKDALLALAFFVLMTLVVFSTLIYFAERGSWDESLELFLNADNRPSQFESIPAAAWYVLVTISTVGYGEITPRSVLGRLFTIPLLLCGLLLIALPSFVLGREFSVLWESMGGGRGTTDTHSVDLSTSPIFPPSSNHRDDNSFELLPRTPGPVIAPPPTITNVEIARELQQTRSEVASLRQELKELTTLLLTKPREGL